MKKEDFAIVVALIAFVGMVSFAAFNIGRTFGQTNAADQSWSLMGPQKSARIWGLTREACIKLTALPKEAFDAPVWCFNLKTGEAIMPEELR